MSKNPLYVVSEKGSVVEEASGLFDFLVKKTGAGPLVEILGEILKSLLASIQNYAGLTWVNQKLKEILDFIGHKVHSFGI